ncbi:MAG: hypothetical protein AAF193_04550, partial [Bacteroidota bacterium]
MNPQYKYDPEDLESLLKHKSFKELLPEEEQFVLRHIQSKEEYESLRKTLLAVASNGNDRVTPRPETKEHLMAMFEEDDRRGFVIWLNSLFGIPQSKSYGPSIAFATVLLAIIGTASVFLLQDNGSNEVFADLREQEKKKSEIQLEPQTNEAKAEGTLLDNSETTNNNIPDSELDERTEISINSSDQFQLADDMLKDGEGNSNLDELIAVEEESEKALELADEEATSTESDAVGNSSVYTNMAQDNHVMDEGTVKFQDTSDEKPEDNAIANNELNKTIDSINGTTIDTGAPSLIVTPPAEQEEIAEFYFDNTAGNSATTLSNVEVQSIRRTAADYDMATDASGSLFKTESEV